MQAVYVIGIGQLPVRKYPDSAEISLASDAAERALLDAQIDPQRIGMLTTGTMLAAQLGNQAQLATHIADALGLRGIETATVDAACSSGGAAARLGFMAVAGGFHEAALVVGVERMTHVDHATATHGLATASDWAREGSHGESFISLNARLMANYMDAYGVDPADFAHFSINAHRNAFGNPNAYLHKHVDAQRYIESRTLIEPIRLMDAPPIADGAAALVLGNAALAREAAAQGKPVIRVLASAVGTDSLGLAGRKDMLTLEGARISAEKAFAQANLSRDAIDFFELHDAYTIITALSLEAVGFAKRGEGVHFGKAGDIALDGQLPISTMGGLKARGHPVGATGVYQLVEATLQLRGDAGANQIANAETALTQSIGGTGATVVTHILAREH